MKSRNISIILCLIFSLILIAGWFYWFQIKPSDIRKDCVKKLYEKRDELKSKGETMTTSLGNLTYRICLARNGMKPEDITPD